LLHGFLKNIVDRGHRDRAVEEVVEELHDATEGTGT
jgi:hypothetical protein